MYRIEEITIQHQHITRLICSLRLREGIQELKEFITKTNDWNLQIKLEQIETSYNYMLSYMRNSTVDPERRTVQSKLLRDTLAVADQAMIMNKLIHSNSGINFIETYKKLKQANPQYSLDHILIELESFTENQAIANLLKTENNANEIEEARQRYEDVQHSLFAVGWAGTVWTPEEEVVARRALESTLIHEYNLCLFVSSITLSFLDSFDKRRLMFLFDAYNHENNQISQRALVGLAIIFQLYYTRLPFYPDVVARLSYLNENEKFAVDLNRVQIQVLRSRDTEKINQKMRDEIIPEMIKSANVHNMRINPDEHAEENDDFNPDWAQEIENSPLADKLREMSELQMEGADVYMSTFAQMKTFPFFKEIMNWFYPFDKHHSMVEKELSKGTGSNIIDLLLDSSFFCDSDKYSMLFLMEQIPKAHRDSMIKQLSEQQVNEIMDQEKTNTLKAFTNNPVMISNMYTHNLYRFFKLFTYRFQFCDIFKEPLQLNEYPVLKDIMYKDHLLKEVVDFHFHKGHYTEAARVYQSILDLSGDDAEMYQKLGFCYQKQKDFDQAIDAYMKADMIKPDNVWTNRHLATCYRSINDYAKAVEYYKKVEEVQPENRSLLFNTGSCLAELYQYDEALKYFFKLDFIEPDLPRTWRAIAWCSFMIKKLDQAMKYYDKILKKNGVAPDYLNAGHVAWCMGDMKRAIELYIKSCELSGSKALFLDIFNKDKEYLLDNGINEYDIALMYDLI